MTFHDLYLRAETEAELAAALSMLLRADPETNTETWITAWDGGACDPIGALALTPPALAPDGVTLIPPEIDPRFHLNLRLRDGGSSTTAIAAAAAPYAITPAAPRRTFA